MSSLLDTVALAKMIDGCIGNLKEEKGVKLSDFSSFLNSMAEATENEVFRALFPSMGLLGFEIEGFRRDVLIAPMITGEEKDKYRRIFSDALKKGEESLTILKCELCEKHDVDYVNIVKAIALLNDSWNNLHDERSVFRPRARRS